MTTPEKTGRNQAGQFAKGASGNPKGKPKGAINKATRAALTLLDGQAEAVTRRAIEMALKGDTVALKLCIDRIVPPRREACLDGLKLPTIHSPADLPNVFASLIGAVGRGELTPGQAEKLARLVGEYGRAVELANFEDRLAVLEQQSKAGQT